jgi:hypothetical protein
LAKQLEYASVIWRTPHSLSALAFDEQNRHRQNKNANDLHARITLRKIIKGIKMDSGQK